MLDNNLSNDSQLTEFPRWISNKHVFGLTHFIITGSTYGCSTELDPLSNPHMLGYWHLQMAHRAEPFIWHPSAVLWLNRFLRSGSKSAIQLNFTKAFTRNQSQPYGSTLQIHSNRIKISYTGQPPYQSHLYRSALHNSLNKSTDRSPSPYPSHLYRLARQIQKQVNR